MVRGRSRPVGTRDTSVARQVLLLQVLVVLVLVVSAIALATFDARNDTRASARERSVAVAETVADAPVLGSALASPDPSHTIQPYAERVRGDTSVDFVVVMAMDRTRYSHPNPEQLGKKFIGDLGGAPDGQVFTQEYTGTLGPSIRSVVPVTIDGEVVAMVSVGITVEKTRDQLISTLPAIAASAAAVLLVGLLGAWLISRRLRRVTHGMGAQEMTRMYEYYEAVLHAVREGMLLLDSDGRVQLVNDEARRLLHLPDDVIGQPLADLGLPPGLVETAVGDTAAVDDIYISGEHVLLVSASPAVWEGHGVGSVVTLRDHTELQSVSGELAAVRGLTDSLRAQNHEAANRLHTIVSLIEMGRPEDAVEFATEELQVAQLLTDRVVGAVEEPVVAALLLGKIAEATERGIELEVTGSVAEHAPVANARDLVTVIGNLVDNAMDAVTGQRDRRVSVQLSTVGTRIEVVVGDSGPGLSEEAAAHAVERGWSTKASADESGRGVGLALVGQVARRHGSRLRFGRSRLGGAEFTVTLGEEAR
ncbi:sensor histidine kinase [Nocardioides sp. JQ2195]|uniref:sensor histidine kinase n=1 Tax=Nocardioides sp. JQ2195 TaxID=2592334 RepID=UPI00143EB314|nr:sensor histidine kinase [Nocardioides sp. JQ2195]QIX26978.1 sensor histidine kinase [Nocardioides sp. JQ2195]